MKDESLTTKDESLPHRRRLFGMARNSWTMLIILCIMTTVPVLADPDTTGISNTVKNIMTVVQLGGLGVAGVFVALCGVKLSHGGRQALGEAKERIIGLVVGIIMIAGASGIKALIQGLNAFQ